MISKRRLQIALFMAAALTAGCEAQNQPPPPSPVSSAAPRTIDEWIGRWNGPEATYLQISKSGDTYEIQIKDLDKGKLTEEPRRATVFHSRETGRPRPFVQERESRQE